MIYVYNTYICVCISLFTRYSYTQRFLSCRATAGSLRFKAREKKACGVYVDYTPSV